MSKLQTQQMFEAVIPLKKIGHSPSYGNVIGLDGGRLLWAWGTGSAEPVRPIQSNISTDGGRTWSDPQPLKLTNGLDMMGVMDGNLMRLRSGALGFVHRARVWAGGGFEADYRAQMHFHKSEDEGNTWSLPVEINPPHQREYITNEVCTMLDDGRIIVPVYDYMGPIPASENPKQVERFGERFAGAARSTFSTCYVYYSDDEGATWTRSRNETFIPIDKGVEGSYAMGEPAVVQLKDGRLLMLGRTNVGRFFKAYSDDRGETWHEPIATDLACPPSPCTIKRIPPTGDLLVIWNQVSRWESMQGLFRHRLSCAVSSDEGETWHHHRNLESLDDTTHVEPVGVSTVLLGGPRQPIDRTRYHRAPGVLRYSYPSCTFVDDTAIITYGASVLGDLSVITGTYGLEIADVMKKVGFEPDAKNPDRTRGNNKVRVVPTDWFYNVPS